MSSSALKRSFSLRKSVKYTFLRFAEFSVKYKPNERSYFDVFLLININFIMTDATFKILFIFLAISTIGCSLFEQTSAAPTFGTIESSTNDDKLQPDHRINRADYDADKSGNSHRENQSDALKEELVVKEYPENDRFDSHYGELKNELLTIPEQQQPSEYEAEEGDAELLVDGGQQSSFVNYPLSHIESSLNDNLSDGVVQSDGVETLASQEKEELVSNLVTAYHQLTESTKSNYDYDDKDDEETEKLNSEEVDGAAKHDNNGRVVKHFFTDGDLATSPFASKLMPVLVGTNLDVLMSNEYKRQLESIINDNPVSDILTSMIALTNQFKRNMNDKIRRLYEEILDSDILDGTDDSENSVKSNNNNNNIGKTVLEEKRTLTAYEFHRPSSSSSSSNGNNNNNNNKTNTSPLDEENRQNPMFKMIMNRILSLFR